MFAKPQTEHQWLAALEGEWNSEAECRMGPDQPVQTMTAPATIRSLGGMWIVMESAGDCPEGGPWQTLQTLGYDPRTESYVGTFIGSMMNHLWLYNGQLEGKRLVLDTVGPKFNEEGMAQYQDIVEVVDDDHFILRSQMLGEDGNWHNFMTAHYRRRK